MTSKQELRAKYKNYDKSGYSELIIKKLKETELYKSAKNIMIYYPLKYEVNLLGLLNDCSKKFYLPKTDGKNLLCCPYSKDDKLCLSLYKTQEPKTKPCDKDTIDLVIVPALACDKNNYRLGYGGGFYDRFLKDFSGKKICCIPKVLILDTVCKENFDIPVDFVITD